MKELITQIQIDASPDKVWAVLSDNAAWGAWNPLIVKSVGALVPGQRITNTMILPDEKPMTFAPKVLKAEKDRELRWLGRLLIPGLFDGEHYFILEPHQGGTRLIHGEIFKGLLIGMLDFKKTEQAFIALNEALKRKVEGA